MGQHVSKFQQGAVVSIQITCQQCQKQYRVKPELAGKRVRCVQCGFAVSVPGDSQGDGELNFVQDATPESPPQLKRPGSAKSAPPPVPRHVVRQDPRFDPQSMSDFQAPPPPSAPPPRSAPPRNPQPTAKKANQQNQPDQELHFAEEDPLFMSKPKVQHDNLDDTA